MAGNIKEKIRRLKTLLTALSFIPGAGFASGSANAQSGDGEEKSLIATLMFYEGCSETAYRCQAGVCTVGIGSTKLPDGSPVTDGYRIKSPQELEQLVKAHIKREIAPVMSSCIKRKLKPCERNALISLCYNCGTKVIGEKGRPSVLAKAVNAHDNKTVMREFLKYMYITRKNSKTGKKTKVLSEALGVRRCGELYEYLGLLSAEEMRNFYIGGYRGLKLADLTRKKVSGVKTKSGVKAKTEYSLKMDLGAVKKFREHCRTAPSWKDAAEMAWFGGDRTVQNYLDRLTYYAFASKPKQQTGNGSTHTM